MKIIAIEEHFYTDDYVAYLRSRKKVPKIDIVEEAGQKFERSWWSQNNYKMTPPNLPYNFSNLIDKERRINEMDKAGIDMQVLSLSFPGVEEFDASEGISMAKAVNDELAETVKRYPERFAGFATIAPQDPEAAADELERAVKKLGLRGVMINGNIQGEYLDEQKYWVILEMAEKLGVPIYIHPKHPSSDMIKPYLAYPGLALPMWGYGAEAGLHAMRLICSGVFDKYPELKIILGHLGEAIPFWLWRIDCRWLFEKESDLAAAKIYNNFQKRPSQYFKDNFYVTTSGMFWQPVLQFVYSVLGADRILFAADYPWESSEEAVHFIESVPINTGDKEKICHSNAEKLLGL
jgi:5-carboxyvanillate decarboxylase